MNAFNSLMNPMAVGQSFQMGMEQGRARRGEMETQNALSMLAKDPNSAEGFEKLAQYNPQAAMQIGQQRQAQAAAQQKQRQMDGGTFRALLYKARENPQQAYMAAQQMGLNLEGVPQPGDPSFTPWLETEIFIQDALADPEKLTSVQADAEAMGLDLGTPEGIAAVRELTLYKYAKQGVDEMGRSTLELPTVRIPAPGTKQAGNAAILPRAARPQGLSDDQLFDMARQRVEQGADVNTVFQQLREWGVEVN